MRRGFGAKDSLQLRWYKALSLAASPQELLDLIEEGKRTGEPIDVNVAIDDVGARYNPLHLLIDHGKCSEKKVKVLVDAGANKNATTMRYTRTPLTLAILRRSIESIECLMLNNFDPDFKDDDGKTPRQYVLELEDSDWFKQAIIAKWGPQIEPIAATNPLASATSASVSTFKTADEVGVVTASSLAAFAPEPKSSLELEGIKADITTPLLAPDATTPASNPASPSIAAKICNAITEAFCRW